jgi:hypothetical protein
MVAGSSASHRYNGWLKSELTSHVAVGTKSAGEQDD